MVIAAIVGQHMHKGQRQATAIPPVGLQHCIPALRAGQAQQQHRPYTLRVGHCIFHHLKAASLQLRYAIAGLIRRLLLKCGQPLQGTGAHGLPPAAQAVLRNHVVKVITSGFHPVAARQ